MCINNPGTNRLYTIRGALSILLGMLICSTILLGANDRPASLETGIEQLGKEISNSMLEVKKTRIAISGFLGPSGKETVLGSYIAESLTTELFRQQKFDIYERSLLSQVLAEHKLGLTGIIDPDTAKRIGRLTGVDAILSGSTVEMTDYVGINTRLISTETGQVFAAARVQILKDPNVRSIVQQRMGTNESISNSKDSESHTIHSPVSLGTFGFLNGTYAVIEGKRTYGTSRDTLYTRKGSVTFQILSIKTDGKTIALNITISVVAEDLKQSPAIIDFLPSYRAAISESEVYLTDSLGERYQMKKCEGCSQSSFSDRQSVNVQAGQSIQIKLTFPISEKSDTQGLTLFLGYVNIPFGLGAFIRS